MNETNKRRFKRGVRAFALLFLPALGFGLTLFLTSASLLPRGQFLVFGPVNYVRDGGNPVSVTKTFTVLNPQTQYFMQIYNGGQDGQFGMVSSAAVTLNGAEVAGPKDFNPNVRVIEKRVTLTSQNTLSVELRSAPRSGITLQIIGIDNDPPTISATQAPAANASGWNNTDVRVTFNCSDAMSGIASCSSPVDVQTDGADQTLTGTAVDRAGNTANTSARVNLDKTAPVINLTSPAADLTTNTADLDITGTATDSLSGIDNLTCNETAAVISGSAFTCHQSLSEGLNTIAIAATDRASNKSSMNLTVNRQSLPPTAPAQIRNIKITPDVIFLGESQNVTVTATIPYDPLGATPQVTLQRVDANGNVIGVEGALVDNGNVAGGDAYRGDGIFTFRKLYSPQAEERVRLRVSFLKDGKEVTSELLNLNFFAHMTNAQFNAILNLQTSARQSYDDLAPSLGADGAKAAVLAQLRQDPAVLEAGASDSGIWILHAPGILGGIDLGAPGTRGGGGGGGGLPPHGLENAPSLLNTPPHIEEEDQASEEDQNRIGKKKAIVLSAFKTEFGVDEGAGVAQLLKDSACPSYDVTYFEDSSVSLFFFKNLDRYGVIVITSHGAVFFDQLTVPWENFFFHSRGVDIAPGGDTATNRGQIVILSSERALPSKDIYEADLRTGRVALIDHPNDHNDVIYYALLPSFIDFYRSGDFSNSLIYMGACHSAANRTMADVFLSHGAKTYLGYNRRVASPFAFLAGSSFFREFITDPESGVGKAIGVWESQIDPFEGAMFVAFGSKDLRGPNPALTNGDFEKGVWGAWDTFGRSSLVTQLGEFGPADGDYMAVLSTDGNAGGDNVSQKVCLTSDAQTLEFDWNLVTEDFSVCQSGTQNPTNDGFGVRISPDPVGVVFFTTVKAQCSLLSPSSVRFGTIQFPTKATGWRHASLDISGFASRSAGKSVTVVFDVGNQRISGFAGDQTIVMIDNVRIVKSGQ